MQTVDFDKYFELYTKAWIAAHEDEYEGYDEMEAQMPEVYAEFLDTPALWLECRTPGAYFDQWDDPRMLVDWMGDYLKRRISVPDMLLNRISALGRAAAPLLIDLLDEESATAEKKMLAVTLLREMDCPLPMERYIDWQCVRGYMDELCDNALESLEQMGESAVPQMLEALDGASPAGQEALLSVLSRFPGDERILEKLLYLFETQDQRRAILAAYLGRLGDTRALPALLERAEDEKLKYFDFIEIRAAIEALGGDAPPREFFGDAEYEALYGAGEPDK